jgi:hypothetical protein
MIVVSFYTNAVYMKHAAELKKSCEAFGIPCEIDQLEDRGGWMKNVQQKPEFIRQKMLKHQEETVVWLDADCVIRAKPELLMGDLACDVAAYSARYAGDVWGSTILFRPTDLAQEVVAQWQLRINEKPMWQDNLCLKFAISLDTPAAKLVQLPISYTWTEWMMRSWDTKAKPVIEHLAVEAKRRYDSRAEEGAKK